MILCARDLDRLNSGTIIMNGPEHQRTYFIKNFYYKWRVCDSTGKTFPEITAMWNQSYDSDQIHFPVYLKGRV